MNDANAVHSGESPRRGRALTIIVVVLAVIAFIGLTTWAIGIGPFGWRLWRYGDVKMFVYNGTQHFAEVTIDGAMYELKPFSGQTLELVGGNLEVQTVLVRVENDPATGKPVKTDKKEELERQAFVADGTNWLYHVALPDSTCGVVADVSNYYDRTRGGEPKLVALVPKDRRLQELDVRELYYPQDFLPDKVEPPVIWLGVVSCALLDDPTLALANVRLQIEEHRKLFERKREEAQRQRGLATP